MNRINHHDGDDARRPERSQPAGRRSLGTVFAVAAAVTLLSACEVTNPGPVNDSALNDEVAHQALVNGAGRALLEAVNEIAYTGGLVAREIFPGGQSGNYGHSPLIQGGSLPDDQVGVHWANAHEARYIAEEAIRRYTAEDVQADPKVLAEAYTWAGYANRLLGENMCQAVFDGGGVEPNIRYFERAHEQFTNAIQHAVDTQHHLAALAGRAQVRVWLGDWDGAVEDARAVPDDYVFWLNASGVDQATYNTLYFGGIGNPYAGYSVWNTYYGVGDDGVAGHYYSETGDPRVRWQEHPELEFAGASLTDYGQVPLHIQLKYPGVDADYRLASGREMRLIEAEALLLEGDWQAAMDIINDDVRASITSDHTDQPLEPWPADSPDEAWTRLKRERGIELWLEARRLGDLRRWTQNETPGDVNLPDFEAASDLFGQQPDARCFPIPETERDANPEIPSSPTG